MSPLATGQAYGVAADIEEASKRASSGARRDRLRPTVATYLPSADYTSDDLRPSKITPECSGQSEGTGTKPTAGGPI